MSFIFPAMTPPAGRHHHESWYVRRLKKTLEDAGFYVIKHADPLTGGIPDLSVSSNSSTTWLEVKIASSAKTLRAREGQLITLRKFSRYARVYYVIFDPSDPCTVIVPPSRLNEWESWSERAPGLNYEYVTRFVQGLHS